MDTSDDVCKQFRASDTGPDGRLEYNVCTEKCCSGDDETPQPSQPSQPSRPATWSSALDIDRAMGRCASILRRGKCLCRREIVQVNLSRCGSSSSSTASRSTKLVPKTSIEEVRGCCSSKRCGTTKAKSTTSETLQSRQSPGQSIAEVDGCCSSKQCGAPRTNSETSEALQSLQSPRASVEKVDGCCSSKQCGTSKAKSATSETSQSRQSTTSAAEEVDACCSSKQCCTTKAKSANSETLQICQSPGSSIEEVDTCCSSKQCDVSKAKSPTSNASQMHEDVEKQAGVEHVVVNVSGMTCTGCSRKLMNVITPIPGVTNPHVVFVSGKAEFDHDSSNEIKLEAVLRRIEQETGFKLSRIVSGRQDINVLMSAADAERLQRQDIPGVISVSRTKGEAYTITYDPALIGARSLLEQGARLAPPSPEARIVQDRLHLRKTAIRTALAAALTIPVLVLEWAPTSISRMAVSITTLVLGTLVQLIAVPEFYVGALKSLIFSRVAEMDMLVVISITSAYVYSVVAFGFEMAGARLEQDAFFETSTLLITLVLLGRLVAAWARMRAVASVSLRSLQTQDALLMQADGDAQDIDARLLHYGDKIKVPAHARIVTDGRVIAGSSEVDESMITGEDIPVVKHVDHKVIAGTVNGSGTLSILVTRLPGENSITDIARLVEDAVASKPKVQEIADKVASWFIPAVMVIATIVFAIWIAVGVQIRDMPAGDAAGLAITYAIAVLAISCPCAIGLAVPMVLVIAGGVAARKGVIIRNADAMERVVKITDVIFDKTGTLTEGGLQVISPQVIPGSKHTRDKIMSIARAIVEGQKHPVAVAVANDLSLFKSDSPKVKLEGITSIPGAGIEAVFEQSVVRAGNPKWLKLEQHAAVVGLLQSGLTIFCLAIDDEPVLVYGLAGNIRSNALSVIAQLQKRGMKCHIVSGDNPSSVSKVAQSLGIPSDRVAAQMTPAGKQKYVQDLQDRGKKTWFVGDGTNDAVAVAQANVGTQMGSASDVTGAVADVVLVSGNLQGVLEFLDLSERSLRRIVFNFGWSAVYNFFAILMTSGALVRFSIPPRFAGLGELVSVLPVIFAAATLLVRPKSRS